MFRSFFEQDHELNLIILGVHAKRGKKALRSLFMDGVQLPQGSSHFEEAV